MPIRRLRIRYVLALVAAGTFLTVAQVTVQSRLQRQSEHLVATEQFFRQRYLGERAARLAADPAGPLDEALGELDRGFESGLQQMERAFGSLAGSDVEALRRVHDRLKAAALEARAQGGSAGPAAEAYVAELERLFRGLEAETGAQLVKVRLLALAFYVFFLLFLAALGWGVLRPAVRAVKEQLAAVTKANHELSDALAHVRQLQGLLPICMHCKRIRDDRQSWQRIETYLSSHADVVFSHALCEECMVKHYPEASDG